MNPSWSANQPYATGWNGNNMGGPTANNPYGIGGSGPMMGSPGRPPQTGPCFGHSHGPMPYGPGPGSYGISNGPGPMGSQSPHMNSPYHNQQPPAVGYQAQYTAIRIPPGPSPTPPMMLRSDSSGNEDSYQGRFDPGGQTAPEVGYSASFEGAAAAGGFAAAGTSSIPSGPAQPVLVAPAAREQGGVIPLPKSYKTYYSPSVPPPIAHKPAFPLLVPPPRPSNMLGPAGAGIQFNPAAGGAYAVGNRLAPPPPSSISICGKPVTPLTGSAAIDPKSRTAIALKYQPLDDVLKVCCLGCELEMYQPLLESHLTLLRCLTATKCPECGSEFPGQLAMKKHYWIAHMFAAKSPREFTCPYGCPDFVAPMPEVRYFGHMKQKHVIAPILDGCEIVREGQTTDKMKCANCPKEYCRN